MVELLLVEEAAGEQRRAAGMYATAESHHHSSISSTMLEPATRLQSPSGFNSALRDIPSFNCSVQPNRSLPLRPAPPVPRRKLFAAPTAASFALHQKLKKQPVNGVTSLNEENGKSLEEKNDQQENTEKRNEEEKGFEVNGVEQNNNGFVGQSEYNKNSRFNGQSAASAGQQSTPVQLETAEPSNGISAETEPPRARIIEDVVVPCSTSSAESPSQLKMVPPLRLKKIGSQPDSLAAAQYPPTPQQQHQQQRNELEDGQEDSSKYCIVTPTREESGSMGGERAAGGCEAKSIEIMIPSVPELGIKETRTDRISLPQESTPSKPFILNYILGKDSQYSALVPASVHIPAMTPAPPGNPDPGGHQPKPNSSPSELSMPLLGNTEEVDNVLIVQQPEESCSPSSTSSGSSGISLSEKKREWFGRRQMLRESFRELRSKAIDSRQKICASSMLLPEDSPQQAHFQEIIDGCDRQINHFSNLLRKLNEAKDSLKFERFCEETEASSRTALGLVPKDEDRNDCALQQADTTLDDTRRVYGSVISETQSSDKSVVVARRDTAPQGINSETPLDVPRTMVQQQKPVTNGFATIIRDIEAHNHSNERRASNAALSIPTTSPGGHAAGTSNHQQAKSVIVEPCTRTPSEPPPLTSSAEMSPSSKHFSIEELTGQKKAATSEPSPAADPSSPVVRPSAYPAQARAPPNSPREALIASSVPGAWAADQQQHARSSIAATEMTQYSRSSVTVTDVTHRVRSSVATTEISHQHQQQQHKVQQQQGGSGEAQVARDERRPLNLAVKATKRPPSTDAPLQPEKEEKKKRRRVSDVTPNHWATSYAQGIKTRIVSTPTAAPVLAREHYIHHPQLQQPAQLYPYVQEATLWSPVEIISESQRQAKHYAEQYQRALAHQEYLLRLQENTMASEQAKVLPKQVQAIHRMKPLLPATEALEQAALNVKNADQQAKAQAQAQALALAQAQVQSASTSHHEQSQVQQPRILGDQFPTLGNWAAGLMKQKQVVDGAAAATTTPAMKKEVERTTPMADTRPGYYQSTNPSIYKSSSEIAAVAAAAGNYAGSGSVHGRWPPSDQQQQQQQQQQAAAAAAAQRSPFQQVQHSGTPSLPRRQTYYPPIAPTTIALSYPAPKFSVSEAPAAKSKPEPGLFDWSCWNEGPSRDLYERSTQFLAHNAHHPYTVSRLPINSLEAAVFAHASSQHQQQQQQQQQQQRMPPLIPLVTSNGTFLERYYSPPEAAAAVAAGSPRLPSSMPYPNYSRRGNLVSVDYATLSPEQSSYAKLLGVKAVNREIQQQQQQRTAQQHQRQQELKSATSEVSRSQYPAGSIYAHSVMPNSRSTSVIGSSISTPSTIYSPLSSPPTPRQPQSSQLQSQQPAPSSSKSGGTAYERECPTPNLGEANRVSSSSLQRIQGTRCSYCGAPGSRFECLGCETTFYCNENCQAQHWAVHATQCPKIMPRLKKVG